MDLTFECPVCRQSVRPRGSECTCTPQRLYTRDQQAQLTREADTELSGNGAGLGVRRPIPNTQG